MPLQTVEELSYIKRKIKKRYGKYGEQVTCAEYVKIQSNERVKERLFVVGLHRVYSFRKSRLQNNLATDYHLYDMQELDYESKDKLVLKFLKSKGVLAQIVIRSTVVEFIVQAIRSSYARITLGYDDKLRCKFKFYDQNALLPLTISSDYPTAGGIISAYEAQCCYFGVYMCIDIIRMIEAIERNKSFDLDLTDCPLVEEPKVMLPLVGALRHNSYFLSLRLTECNGNQQVLLMIANLVRFNTTITKLVLANLDSPGTFEVLGSSLINNKQHAIQVLDISKNKIPSLAMDTICEALAEYSHALLALHLQECQLSKKSIQLLVNCFKKNYGMSMSIQLLDLSHNRLGGRGSCWLGNWMNMVRFDSHLKHLILANTNLAFVFIGRPLVHFTHLHSLDISFNKLDLASVQLLTLWIETSMELQYMNFSDCGLTGEFAGKLLSVILFNRNLSNVRIYLNHNDLKKETDGDLIVEALRRGSNIHTLSLSRNKFKEKSLIAIIDALQQHPSLHTLILDQTYKGSLSPNIAQIVGSALAILVNQNNNIRSLSISGSFQNIVIHFLEALQSNAALEQLDISRNQLKDTGASCIADVMRKNVNLRLLMLDDNLITYSGYQAILQIFSVNQALQHIPFPWEDYQKLIPKLTPFWQTKLRDLLTLIQKMCSINQARCTNQQDYHLFVKDTVKKEFPTPLTVSPLANIPDQLPEEINEDDQNTLFTFGDDSSDEGETEMELVNLQENIKRLSTIKKNSGKDEFKSLSDSDDDDFDFDAPELPSRDAAPPLPQKDTPTLPPRGNDTAGLGITNQPPLPSRTSTPTGPPTPPITNTLPLPPRNTPDQGLVVVPATPIPLPPRTTPVPETSSIPQPPPPAPTQVAVPKGRSRKKTLSMPSTKDYVFSDSDISSDEEPDNKKKVLSASTSKLFDSQSSQYCSSIGELLLQVMDRRSAIEVEEEGEEPDDSASDDDSW